MVNMFGQTYRRKVWLHVGGRFLTGEGDAALLTAVAAREVRSRRVLGRLGSYRHAWRYLRRAEAALSLRWLRLGRARGQHEVPR